MTTKWTYRGLLSMVLASALVFFSVLSASAAEFTDETTEPPETTEIVETTEIIEEPAYTEATQSTESTETTEATQASEPTETTVPDWTTAETASTEETESLPVEDETIPVVPMLLTAEPSVVTIAQAWEMPAGTLDITIQGTVVFVSGTQAVLQDSAGGIRLSFSAAPDAALGDVLLVTGDRSGGFSVTAFEKTGTAPLPAVETTLLAAEENVRVVVRNATLGSGTLYQDGISLILRANLPGTVAVGDSVDAYGVILDGRFYADTLTPAAYAQEDTQQEWNIYFGQLHAHTEISDGTGTVAEAFQYAANVEGLDFFAVTDHSNSFDNAGDGAINLDGTTISTEWAEGKAAAAAVTDETFVGIFGYEMTWGEDLALGHINTFNTPGWQTREQSGFDTLESYYEALAKVPGSVSQFNHPSPAYGEFNGFANYDPVYDESVRLLEVGGEDGATFYKYYTKALDQGWHVAPTNSQNNHEGSWGDVSSVRTAVLAEELTEESLYDAMRSYRVYATEDSDLEIYYTLNGQIMGSIISATEQLEVSVSLSDLTDTAIGTVEVIVDGGETAVTRTVADPVADLTMTVPSGYSYYYLRITQPDGDVAVTAPVWVDSYENIGISSFHADTDQPDEGQEVTLTLELFNLEKVAFSLENIQFTQGETVIHQASTPGTVSGMDSLSYSCAFTWPESGEVSLLAVVTGTVEGETRTYEQTLTLHYQPASVTISSTIAQARSGTLGTAYCVQGYVTAGNASAYNTFPNTIYLQDDTGGIAVVGTFASGIQVGAPMEVTGCLKNQNGNLILDLTEYTLLEGDYYRYVPRTMTHSVAMDYSAHGGELLQVEGKVVSLTATADGKGISRFTIQDVVGDLATVVIEEEILSGTYGVNELASQVKKGRTVRAMGLLHVDEYGTTVLRVRNCDEVVYVPATADPSNPKTSDLFLFWK